MEEDGQQTTPFWLQSSTYFQPSNHRRRAASSICFNSGVLIIVLSVFALITIFFIVPSFLAFTSQVFRPNVVKKSWDSLNFVLVLFAIVCGFLGRRKDDGDSSIASNAVHVPEEPRQQVQPEWFGYSDQRVDEPVRMPMLKRNSSSYPDLRQESSWASSADENWRFFDDSYIYNRRRHQEVYRDAGIKAIPVDKYVVRQREVSSPPSASPPPAFTPQVSTQPPPPPPLPGRRPSPTSEVKQKTRRTFHSVPQKDSSEIAEMEFKKAHSPIPATPPPPPPPPPPPLETRANGSEKKFRKSERKKSSGAKEIASTLASLYNQRKRKKKQRSKENFDDILLAAPDIHSASPPSPPPPPPPLSPSASIFDQLFNKGSKSKRIHSVSSSNRSPPPPPPPPPPPMSPMRSYKQETHRQRPMTQTSPPAPPSEYSRPRKPMTPGRPPLPSKINSFYDENMNSGGNQSPLVPMPPPPPPPPFKVKGFKFVVQGDYVRLQSSHSSRSTSPDLDAIDTPPTSTPATPTTTDAGEPGHSVFCPSPDVNSKADTFIARLKAGWRMEKVNSFKEKQDMSTSDPIAIQTPRSSPSQR